MIFQRQPMGRMFVFHLRGKATLLESQWNTVFGLPTPQNWEQRNFMTVCIFSSPSNVVCNTTYDSSISY